ncbi:MAG: heme o synthase [Alphaproteobacteria bacterium]|nr:heme o synthase [Alphaproteobacteria bacterium]
MAQTLGAQQIVASPQLADPGDFIALMKPRVMSLVVFTTVVGMVLAPTATHPLLALISIIAIAAGAGASGAINQWYDRDIDAVMTRTKTRPIPAGKVMPEEALSLGVIISLLSVLVLWFSAGFAAAALLGFTIFFYAVVYSVWLKRATPQNIVIGGAAGAFPPAIGWLAAGGDMTIEPLVLFSIIFIWTPPHFWALALVKNDDYTRAGIPMMPVVAGAKSTRLQITLYSIALAPVGVLPSVIGMASIGYGVVAAVLGGIFLALAVKLQRDGSDANAMGLFKYSILYLFLVFFALGIDGAVSSFIGGA